MHPSGKEIKAVAARMGRARVIKRVMAHLERGCERCSRLFSELAEERPTWQGPTYADVQWASVWDELAEAGAAGRQDLLSELEGLPRGRQLMLVRSSKRFQKLSLVKALCQRSRELLGQEAQEACRLGRLAVATAEVVDRDQYPTGLVEDYLAKAWMRLADAERRASDLVACQEGMGHAERILASGTGDTLEFAELAFLRGNLLMDQGCAEEALRALDRAVALFDDANDPTEAGKAVAHQAIVLAEAGELKAAIAMVMKASILMGAKTAHQALMIFHNIALYMTEIGWLRPALEVVRQARPLYKRAGKESGLLRGVWLEAMILVRLGWTRQGLEKFARAREGFLKGGWLLEATRVTLEEALHSTPRRRMELLGLVIGEMLPELRARGLQREALAALQLLDETLKESAQVLAIEAALKALESARLRGRGKPS